MTRDPRLDPRPGDVLRMPSGYQRHVSIRNGPFVGWSSFSPSGGLVCMYVTGRVVRWSRESGLATVLTVATSREEGRG